MAWTKTQGNANVVIAVIDTGVDYEHSDIVKNIWTNPDEIPGNGRDDDRNGFVDDANGWDFAEEDNTPSDPHGHGTHVAGTIGAVGNNELGISGVMWNVKIMPIRYLDSAARGDMVGAVRSIEYAILNGAHIINASWGGDEFSLLLRDVIMTAHEEGVIFVAAAGNDDGSNNDGAPTYPASYDLPNIISVAATGQDGLLADFSNVGPTSVDLAAPGVDIISLNAHGRGKCDRSKETRECF